MVHYGEMVKMTEEQVTKEILSWLIHNKWKIVTFDFPQSGTGKYLHPNKVSRENQTKNLKAFIPDIVAVKEDKALFFENKNRFFLDDFKKLHDIKTIDNYSESINKLLTSHPVTNIFYGIGAIRNKVFLTKAAEHYHLVDFIVLLDGGIHIEKDDFNLF